MNSPAVSFPHDGVDGVPGDGAVRDEGVSGDDGAFLHGAHVGHAVHVDAGRVRRAADLQVKKELSDAIPNPISRKAQAIYFL